MPLAQSSMAAFLTSKAKENTRPFDGLVCDDDDFSSKPFKVATSQAAAAASAPKKRGAGTAPKSDDCKRAKGAPLAGQPAARPPMPPLPPLKPLLTKLPEEARPHVLQTWQGLKVLHSLSPRFCVDGARLSPPTLDELEEMLAAPETCACCFAHGGALGEVHIALLNMLLDTEADELDAADHGDTPGASLALRFGAGCAAAEDAAGTSAAATPASLGPRVFAEELVPRLREACMLLDEITWVDVLHGYLRWIFASEGASLRSLLPALHQLQQHLDLGEPYHRASAALKAASLAELCDRGFDCHKEDLEAMCKELEREDKLSAKAKKEAEKAQKAAAKQAHKVSKGKLGGFGGGGSSSGDSNTPPSGDSRAADAKTRAAADAKLDGVADARRRRAEEEQLRLLPLGRDREGSCYYVLGEPAAEPALDAPRTSADELPPPPAGRLLVEWVRRPDPNPASFKRSWGEAGEERRWGEVRSRTALCAALELSSDARDRSLLAALRALDREGAAETAPRLPSTPVGTAVASASAASTSAASTSVASTSVASTSVACTSAATAASTSSAVANALGSTAAAPAVVSAALGFRVTGHEWLGRRVRLIDEDDGKVSDATLVGFLPAGADEDAHGEATADATMDEVPDAPLPGLPCLCFRTHDGRTLREAEAAEALAEAAEADLRFLRRNMLFAQQLLERATPKAHAKKKLKRAPADGDGRATEVGGDGGGAGSGCDGGGDVDDGDGASAATAWATDIARASAPRDFAPLLRSLHERMVHAAAEGTDEAAALEARRAVWQRGWLQRLAASPSLSPMGLRLLELEAMLLPSQDAVVPHSNLAQGMRAGAMVQVADERGQWHDATVVACWRDASFRVGRAVKRSVPSDPAWLLTDFSSPAEPDGRRLLHRQWRPWPKVMASRQPSAAPTAKKGGASTAAAASRRRAAHAQVAAGGMRERRGAADRACAAFQRVAADEDEDEEAGSEVDGSASGSDDDDEEEPPTMGDIVEVRVDSTDGGGGGRGGGKRNSRAKWVAAEVIRTFRGGSFEARPKGDGDSEVTPPKLKRELSDVGRTWRKIVG